METGLVNFSANQFESMSPEQFSVAIADVTRSNPDAAHHPIVREAIEHYQSEFFKRKGQMQHSSLERLTYAWGRFVHWCVENNKISLPASHETVEEYLVFHEKKLHRNTLSIHLWAVSKTHRISGLPDPTTHEFVKGQIKQIRNKKIRGREVVKQASPFRDCHLTKLFELWANTEKINDLRDLMIMSIAYETGLRASNLRNIKIGDYYTDDDGTGRLIIPFTKTNHTGRDETKFLSCDTVELIERYLDHEKIIDDKESYLIQRAKISGVKSAKNTLTSEKMVGKNFVGNVFGRVWKVLDLGGKKLSGHSARVGVAQDLYEDNISHTQIMQLLGWSTTAMLVKYTSKANAGNSAMANRRRGHSRLQS